VGRLAPEKNLEYLTNAVAQFCAKTPRAVFAVAGAGPSEAILIATFAKHAIPKKLLLLGKLTGAALHEAYRGMDAFAFASKSETQGMVLAEAMAAGLPVVALDASGVREVVRNQSNGYMLAEDEPLARFAAALTRLASSPERREKFARAARTTADQFSKKNCAAKALKFYGEILKATRRERLLTWLNPWGTLLERLSVEWNLLAEKTHAVAEAVAAVNEQKSRRLITI
jgi:glycosyltransferase involved in cell wall biosynthesis